MDPDPMSPKLSGGMNEALHLQNYKCACIGCAGVSSDPLNPLQVET